MPPISNSWSWGEYMPVSNVGATTSTSGTTGGSNTLTLRNVEYVDLDTIIPQADLETIFRSGLSGSSHQERTINNDRELEEKTKQSLDFIESLKKTEVFDEEDYAKKCLEILNRAEKEQDFSDAFFTIMQNGCFDVVDDIFIPCFNVRGIVQFFNDYVTENDSSIELKNLLISKAKSLDKSLNSKINNGEEIVSTINTRHISQFSYAFGGIPIINENRFLASRGMDTLEPF